jgi:hypothetical protein
MKTKDEPIKKASSNPVKEAIGHPDGPGLEELINGEEEKKLNKNKKIKPENGEPDDDPIPVI